MFGFVGITLALGGLNAFTIGLTILVRKVLFYYYSTTAFGEIVGHEPREEGRTTWYYPIVEFKLGDRKNAVKYRFVAEAGKKRPSNKIGKQVSVRYLPQKPEIAQINDLVNLWLAAFGYLLIGAAVMGVGLGMFGAFGK